MSKNKAKYCSNCGAVKWYDPIDHFTVECCGERLNVTPNQANYYIQSVFDVAKIENPDRPAGFHNGLNEQLPSTATWAYVENRAAAKGLSISRENDPRKLRGTKVNVPQRVS